MAQAKQGDSVSVHYTGRLEDGTVFDSSQDREPIAFTLGEGRVIAGLEEAVQGMEVGDIKTAVIPSQAAYGERQDELVLKIPRTQFPQHIDPEPGQRLQMQTQEGQAVPVVITDVGEEVVEIDANHPLAGANLVFDIELVRIG